jgi:hypothetical protein
MKIFDVMASHRYQSGEIFVEYVPLTSNMSCLFNTQWKALADILADSKLNESGSTTVLYAADVFPNLPQKDNPWNQALFLYSFMANSKHITSMPTLSLQCKIAWIDLLIAGKTPRLVIQGESIHHYDFAGKMLREIVFDDNIDTSSKVKKDAYARLRHLVRNELIESNENERGRLLCFDTYNDQERIEYAYDMVDDLCCDAETISMVLASFLGDKSCGEFHQEALELMLDYYYRRGDINNALIFAQRLHGCTESNIKSNWNRVIRQLNALQNPAKNRGADSTSEDSQEQRELAQLQIYLEEESLARERRRDELAQRRTRLQQQRQQQNREYTDDFSYRSQASGGVAGGGAAAAQAESQPAGKLFAVLLGVQAHPEIEHDLNCLTDDLQQKYREHVRILQTGNISCRHNSKMKSYEYKSSKGERRAIFHCRLNDEHRLFYVRNGRTLIILQAGGHEFKESRLSYQPHEISNEISEISDTHLIVSP